MYRDMCKGGEVSRGDALILSYIYFYFQGHRAGGRQIVLFQVDRIIKEQIWITPHSRLILFYFHSTHIVESSSTPEVSAQI